MIEHSAAKSYLSDLRDLQDLASAAHDIFAGLGCSSYVKTIYIGYDIGGEMVAALYGRSDYVEIALALPEDYVHPLVIDASHLTWRTLPVAAILRELNDLGDFRNVAAVACERVKRAQHNVSRDNDFFMEAKRRRRGR